MNTVQMRSDYDDDEYIGVGILHLTEGGDYKVEDTMWSKEDFNSVRTYVTDESGVVMMVAEDSDHLPQIVFAQSIDLEFIDTEV